MVKKVAKREMSSLEELALEVLRFMQVVAMLDKLVLAGVLERVSGFWFPVTSLFYWWLWIVLPTAEHLTIEM